MRFLSVFTTFTLFFSTAFASNDFAVYPEPLKAPVSLFENERGQLQTLGSFQNKVVILNFWATWCKPCIIEMPSLLQLKRKYKAQGLEILPIVGSTEDVSKVRSFYRRYKLKELGYYKDSTELTKQSYQVEAVPTSFIFSKQGKLIAYVSGMINWMSPENQKFIEELLAE